MPKKKSFVDKSIREVLVGTPEGQARARTQRANDAKFIKNTVEKGLKSLNKAVGGKAKSAPKRKPYDPR